MRYQLIPTRIAKRVMVASSGLEDIETEKFCQRVDKAARKLIDSVEELLAVPEKAERIDVSLWAGLPEVHLKSGDVAKKLKEEDQLAVDIKQTVQKALQAAVEQHVHEAYDASLENAAARRPQRVPVRASTSVS